MSENTWADKNKAIIDEFRANDGVRGAELWRTDGSSAGTRLVAEVRPSWNDGDISDIVAVGNRVFFFADDVNADLIPDILTLDATLNLGLALIQLFLLLGLLAIGNIP